MFELLNPINAISAVGGYLEQGGPVVVAIMVFAFAMWTLIIERLVYFSTQSHHTIRAKQEAWALRDDHSSWYAHVIRDKLISQLRLESSRFLGVIKALILAMPLLGLLGTVTGMIEVFEVVTDRGSNARMMAEGIYRATIPTMTGLAISLSGIPFRTFLDRQLTRSVAELADSLDIHHQPAGVHAGQQE